MLLYNSLFHESYRGFYMKYLIIVLLAVFSYHLEAVQIKKLQQNVVMEQKMSLDVCRHYIQELTANNPKVLEQFDCFAERLQQTFSSKELPRILEATKFAAEKHQFQKRKNAEKTPYIIHPIFVAYHLIVIGHLGDRTDDTDIIIAALLHDTVEDTQTTFEEIEKKFGSVVVGYVKEVTDDKSLPKQERKKLQIINAPHKSAGAAQIKLADKYSNLSDILLSPPLDWDAERIDAYFNWAQQVVDALPPVNKALRHVVYDLFDIYRLSQE